MQDMNGFEKYFLNIKLYVKECNADNNWINDVIVIIISIDTNINRNPIEGHTLVSHQITFEI